MRLISIFTELTRMLWVIFSLAVLLQFAREVFDEAGVVTLPYFIACTTVVIEIMLALIFSSDWLAKILNALGISKAAEEMQKNSIAAWSKSFGKNAPFLAAKQCHLAELYLMQGRHEEAAAIFESVISRWKDHWWNFLSPSCKSLASYKHFLKKNNHLADAERIGKLTKSWQLGVILPTTLVVIIVSGAATYILYVKQIRRDIAELTASDAKYSAKNARDLVDELAKAESRLLGPEAPARLYHGVAWSSYFPAEERDVSNTEWACRRAIPFARKSSATNKNLAEALTWLGEISLDKGETEEAGKLYLEAESALSSEKETSSSKYNLLMNQARLFQVQKQYEKSRAYYQRAAAAADEVYGKQSEYYAEALIQLVGTQIHLPDKQAAEKVADEACQVSEEIYNTELSVDIPSKTSYRRLLSALVEKQEVLNALGKEAEAQRVAEHIAEVQNAKMKRFKLDPQTQDWIVDAAQELSRCILSIRFRDKDFEKSHKRLKELLSDSAQRTLEILDWSANTDGNLKGSANKNESIDANFSDINVESPDPAGMLAVKVRGVFRTNPRSDYAPFGFYYRLKLAEASSKKVLVDRVAELVSPPFGAE